MSRLTPLLFFLLSTCLSFAQTTENDKTLISPELTENDLFFLQRTKNTNTIMYELNMNEDGTLNEDEPVNVYWRHYELGPNVKNEMGYFPKTHAYGVVSEKLQDKVDEYSIQLKAFKKKALKLAKDKTGKFVAKMAINGKEALLNRIYVNSEEGVFTATVIHVDLFGTDPETGEAVTERVFP
jgi:hypothetical protein